MTLKRLLLTSAFMLAAAAPQVAAQVVGPQGGRPVSPRLPQPPPFGRSVPHTTTLEDSYVATRSVSGELREVNLDEGYILVAIPKKGTGRFYVGDKTRLRADKETTLGDRKKLTLEDFQKGQTVKVTFWPDNFNATEVRARQLKN